MSPLAAVLYSKGVSCDLLLAGIARSLQEQGLRLAGAVQINEDYEALCACDMTLRDLSSGRDVRISQRLGRFSRGCRLDPSAMAESVSLAETGLAAGADLVILNKFGKAEAAGHGFRSLVAAAVERDIPVLVGISEVNLAAWTEFTGGEGTVLPPLDQPVLRWLHQQIGPRRARA